MVQPWSKTPSTRYTAFIGMTVKKLSASETLFLSKHLSIPALNRFPIGKPRIAPQMRRAYRKLRTSGAHWKGCSDRNSGLGYRKTWEAPPYPTKRGLFLHEKSEQTFIYE
jgi:hypothetical protein